MPVPGMTPREISGSSSLAGSPTVGRFERIVKRLHSFARQQAIAFGLLRIVVVCLAAWGTYAHERAVIADDNNRFAAELARAYGRFAANELAGLGALLAHLTDRAASGGAADWDTLAADGAALLGDRGAIALFNSNGAAAAGPARDLSEAEVRAALEPAAAADSRVAILTDGRIAVVRRLSDRNGRILGAAAALVRPESVIAAAFDGGPNGGGVALIDRGGRVLAGQGELADPSTGATLGLAEPLRGAAPGVPEALGDPPGFVVAVASSPLAVVAAPADIDQDPRLVRWRAVCILAAIILTLLISAAAYGLALRAARFEARIAEQARRDPLTGLANRAVIRARIDEAFAVASDVGAIALLVIDLDRFKYVNDTHGHPVGDELLCMVAERLRGLAGPKDLVGRLGGDEFAVVQPVAGYGEEAGVLALRVCRELAAPYEIGAIHAVVGASVGVAFAARDANATGELEKAADMALYAAKAQGRGAIRFFHPEMRNAVQRKVTIEGGLRNAIKRNELSLAYQPIKEARSEVTVGYEALLRWRFGASLVPPAEFIPVAEETGLIVPIGAWALERACADMARTPGQGRVAVNCSPVQLESFDFASHVGKCLAHFGLSADRLEIEVTESFVINDSPRIAAQLRRLKEMGLRISLDDFGTGYSSLNCLEQYPFDTVKIDRSFVQKLERREATRATVKAIIELASSFGMTTIAEGVETRGQLAAVVELGCAEAQGYLFGEPKPLDEVLALASLEARVVRESRRYG